MNKGIEQQLRLEKKIRDLGGEIPAPWEWAIIKRMSRGRIKVDTTMYNLQLIELIEDLQKKAVEEASKHLSPAALQNFKLHQEKP